MKWSDWDFHLLDHEEVVEHVLETAVVRETVEKNTNGFFRLHVAHRSKRSIAQPGDVACIYTVPTVEIRIISARKARREERRDYDKRWRR